MKQKKEIQARPAQLQKKESGFFMHNKEIILLGFVILLTFLIYSPALNHAFTNWDDNDYVTENPYVKAISVDNINHIFREPMALNYHPLTMISLALNYSLSGNDPWSYFLVNILLHLCNIILTFYFAYLLLDRNKVMALFIAAVFALHPMHVESVAWVAERKDTLYAFFFLSGLIAWLFYVNKRKWKWYLLSLVLFLLSGFSKPSSVVFPFVLLLIDYLNRQKFSFRLIVEKLPFILISIGIGIATLHAQVGKAVVDIKQYNLVQQMLFASYGFFIYIFKLIIPTGLSALHPVPVFNANLDLPAIYYASPVLDLIIIGSVIYSLKYTRLLAFGLIFYFLNIVLTLQFFQVGSAVIAERYTYMAYTGLLIGLVWLIGQASAKYKVPMSRFYILMVIFCGFLAFAAARRVSVWKNSGTLWEDVIKSYPKSYTAYNNLGYYYVTVNNLDKAEAEFTKSLEYQPDFVDALNNRATAYRLKKKNREAVTDYTRAITLNPRHIKALTGRGTSYGELGILDSALNDFNTAYAIDSLAAFTFCDRGAVYFKLGRYKDAIEECSRKIAYNPKNMDAYLNRAVAYSVLEQWDPAIRDYSVVINAGTDNVAVYEWRGVSYTNIGQFQLAINDFTQGLKIDSNRASLYSNRAQAYTKLKMLKESAIDLEKARQLGAVVPNPTSATD